MITVVDKRHLRKERARKAAGPLAALAALLVLGGLVAAVVFAVLGAGGVVPSPAGVVAEPVRAVTAEGDRVYLMTSQWRSFRSRSSYSGTSYTRLFVDVWGFDAASVKPVWRTRIADRRGAVNMGRKILGVHGGVLWLLDGKELVGLSPKDGARIAGAASLAAANPALKGLVPSEERYFRFDPKGLSFTAADGRDWRLTGQGSATAPDGPRLTTDQQRARQEPGVFIPANTAGGIGSWAFYTRAINVDGKMWLGLLDEAEAAVLDENDAIGGVDPERHPRVRVWSGRLGSRSGFFGARATVADLKPLPESPEFLLAGLLEDNRCCHDTPILLRQPDSVLVLHKTRLGQDGGFRLTRLSGPLGKPLWTVDLPLGALEAVMPGRDSLVIYGRRDEKRLFGRDKSLESVDQLVSIDHATGKLSAYGFRIKATNPEEIPPSSTVIPAS